MVIYEDPNGRGIPITTNNHLYCIDESLLEFAKKYAQGEIDITERLTKEEILILKK